MIFSLENLMQSIAAVLVKEYEYPVYTSPNQQGTSVPCFFVFQMPFRIEEHVDERIFRDIGIDIVFVQERSNVNGYGRIREIQEYLDMALDSVPYTDGTAPAVTIHTYERQASIEDDELHYQFHIRQRMSVPREQNPMKEMEGNYVNIEKKD